MPLAEHLCLLTDLYRNVLGKREVSPDSSSDRITEEQVHIQASATEDKDIMPDIPQGEPPTTIMVQSDSDSSRQCSRQDSMRGSSSTLDATVSRYNHLHPQKQVAILTQQQCFRSPSRPHRHDTGET